MFIIDCWFFGCGVRYIMDSDESGKWVLSVCGLNCAKCDIYLAGRGDEKLLNEILEWFRKERGLTFEA